FYSLPLAALQIETGQVEAAIRNSEAGVAIIAQHSDPTSFRYANALFHRGTAWLAARQPQKALPDLDQAAVILKQALPVGHATTRLVAATRGLGLARAGRYRDASEVLEPLLGAQA